MAGMVWNERQRKIGEAILRHRREDDTYDLNQVMIEVPGVSKGIISGVAKVLKAGNWTIPPVPVKETKSTAQGGSLATFAQRKPGAIVFSLGDVDIPLNPKFLYDTYLYYQDIQRMSPDIDDDFCMAIRATMRHSWEHFSHDQAEKMGATIREVK